MPTPERESPPTVPTALPAPGAPQADIPMAVVTNVDVEAGRSRKFEAGVPLVSAGESKSAGERDLPLAEVSFAHWSEEHAAKDRERRLASLYEQGFALAEAAGSADPDDFGLAVGLLSQAADHFIQAMEIEPDGAKTALLERQVSMFLRQIATLKGKQSAAESAATAAAAAAAAATEDTPVIEGKTKGERAASERRDGGGEGGGNGRSEAEGGGRRDGHAHSNAGVPVALPVTSSTRAIDFSSVPNKPESPSTSTPHQKSAERLAHEDRLAQAQRSLEQAMSQDEQSGGSTNKALPLYEKAAALYLEISRVDPSVEPNKLLRAGFLQRTSDILDRMEAIKQMDRESDGKGGGAQSPSNKLFGLNIPEAPTSPPGSSKHSSPAGTTSPHLSTPPKRLRDALGRRGNNDDDDDDNNKSTTNTNRSSSVPGGSRLTAPEKKVLAASSRINGRLYLPWLGRESEEKFSLSRPFVDPDGLLVLSAKQKKHLRGWMRPSEFMSIRNGNSRGKPAPKMIALVSPYTIRQVLVTDCSFVSSLCIAASYERRSGKKLITSIIYPQDRRGVPVYNPSGKYMVKLWLNGVPRKVVIDDRLPVGRGRDAKLLGSYTTSRNELWVSIIEKAYMKIHGGYDFPGSNSGIDLFALTGWIPEGHRMHRKDFQKHRTWQRLVNAHKFGDCLVTVATGQMDDATAERLGLVPTHAYAVLDVREACGVRMVLVKNPWSHMRWKGKYSPEDTRSWTPQMRKALRYDLHGANQNDNGIFWIDYDSLVTSFNGLYLNWNRDLFQYRTSQHHYWPENDGGPKNDSYNIGYNPQYHLVVDHTASASVGGERGREGAGAPKKRASAAVWILLTRHVVNKHFEADDMEQQGQTKQQYLTIQLYHNNGSETSAGFGAGRGKRMFFGKKPFMTVPYSNNPHTLIRFDVPPQPKHRGGDRAAAAAARGVEGASYTVVVSQYEKTRDLSFTLDVFSMAPFKLRPLPRTLGREIMVQGEWRKAVPPSDPGSAGGSARNVSFMHNPQWCLNLPKASRAGLRMRLRAPKGMYVNVRLMRSAGGARVTDTSIPSDAGATELLTSGDYREGFCYAETKRPIPAGKYTLIVSTWKSNQHGPYLMFVETAADCVSSSLRKIPAEGHGKRRMVLHGRWSSATGTAAGCANYGRYSNNPRHRLTLHSAAHVLVRLQLRTHRSSVSLNLAMMREGQEHEKVPLVSTNGGVYTNWICGVVFKEEVALEAGTYTLVPSTFKPVDAEYTLIVYSSDRTSSLQ